MIDDVTREKMLQMADEATEYSYVPYSHYPVGACLHTADGTLIRASNVENASFGLTCCAERNAIFKAVSDGHQSFDAIAITNRSDEMPYPCGACRQVMLEFCDGDTIVMVRNQKGDVESYTLDELIPHSFLKTQLLEEPK